MSLGAVVFLFILSITTSSIYAQHRELTPIERFFVFSTWETRQKGSEFASRAADESVYIYTYAHTYAGSSFKCAHSSQKQQQARCFCAIVRTRRTRAARFFLSLARSHSVCIQFQRRELHSGGAVASQFNHFIIPRERFCWHKVPPNYHKRAFPLCDRGGRRRRDNSNNTSALAIIRLFIAFFRPCCNKNATAHLTFSSLPLAELKSERIIIYALVCAPYSM